MIFNTLPQDDDSRCSTLEKLLAFWMSSQYQTSWRVLQLDIDAIGIVCVKILQPDYA